MRGDKRKDMDTGSGMRECDDVELFEIWDEGIEMNGEILGDMDEVRGMMAEDRRINGKERAGETYKDVETLRGKRSEGLGELTENKALWCED
jgi:hypothetical protein